MILEKERGFVGAHSGECRKSEDSNQADLTSSSKHHAIKQKDCNKEEMPEEPDNTLKQELEAEIDQYGLLRLDQKTARRYCQTYNDRINTMHPFLVQFKLPMHPFLDQSIYRIETDVDCFIGRHCPQDCTPGIFFREHLFLFTEGAQAYEDVNAPGDDRRGAENAASASTRPLVERTIRNAIILLVFALGAICESKSPIQGWIVDEEFEYRHQYIPPSWASLDITDSGRASMADLNRDARVSKASSKRSIMSNGGIDGNFFQNPEVIPGLSLYRFATVILGQVQVPRWALGPDLGVELERAQAFLLAALYSNQICHPLQAHSWIWQASRVCQILIRPVRYERLEACIAQDLVNFVYWSCLQLESELLAEMDFPESGISDSESRISLPSGKFILDQPNNLSASSTRMMDFYSAQIHLHKISSRIKTELSKNAEQIRHHGSSVVQNDLEMSLFRWRKSLPRALQWQDAHPPTTYVNAARLRAKYYDMLHLIYRPALFHVLHCGQTDVPITSVGKPSVDSSMKSSSVRQLPLDVSNVRTQSTIEPSSPVRRDWKSPTVSAHELTDQYYRSCKICAESAILSAKAFDGIEDRLVLSNIFATAHAQLGKMLVLSAVYDSSIHHLVEGFTVAPLLERTIRFLLRNGSISPTLRADARILSEIHEKMFEDALSDIWISPNWSTAPYNYENHVSRLRDMKSTWSRLSPATKRMNIGKMRFLFI